MELEGPLSEVPVHPQVILHGLYHSDCTNQLSNCLAVMSKLCCPPADYIYFSSSPSSYYYLSPGSAVIIPCMAYQVLSDQDDTETLLNATFYRDSLPIHLYNPPPDHYIHLVSDRVVGLIVVSVQEEDSGSQYYCRVGQNITLDSDVSTLYIGGRWCDMLGIEDSYNEAR